MVARIVAAPDPESQEQRRLLRAAPGGADSPDFPGEARNDCLAFSGAWPHYAGSI